MWVLDTALPRDAHVISLRGLYPLGEDSYSWVGSSVDGWPTVVDFNPAVDELERVVRVLEQDGVINLKRMLLMGFSQGAALGFAASARLKPMGLIVAAGFMPIGDLLGLQGQQVFWGHGSLDEWIPITRAREDAQRLSALGADIHFCESEVKHKLGLECLQGLRKWLKILVGNKGGEEK